MKPGWIVVADAQQARVFERVTPRGRLHPLAWLVPPEGGSAGGAHFAARVARHLDEGVRGDRCAELLLFAPDGLLGAIRGQLEAATARALRLALAVDWVECSISELEQRIAGLPGAAGPRAEA